MHLQIFLCILTCLTVQSAEIQNVLEPIDGCYLDGVTHAAGARLPHDCFDMICTFNEVNSVFEWLLTNAIDSSCCYFNGVTYRVGERLPGVCFEMSCTFNEATSLHEWKFTDTIDSSCAVCHAVNDPHFRTFDGHRYDWHGTCSYSLSQYLECDGSYDPKFGIFGDFVTCGTASCVDITTYKINANTVATIKHTNPPSLSVNGYPVSLTTEPQLVYGPVSGVVYPLLAKKDALGGGLDCIFLQGIDFSVRACYDSLYIYTTADHKNKLHGLCGYYSGFTGDDYYKRDCTIYPLTSSNILPFATSWLTSQQSDKDCKLVTISSEVKCTDEENSRYRDICTRAIAEYPVGCARTRLIDDCVNDCCRNPSECANVWTKNEQDLALQAIAFGLVENIFCHVDDRLAKGGIQ